MFLTYILNPHALTLLYSLRNLQQVIICLLITYLSTLKTEEKWLQSWRQNRLSRFTNGHFRFSLSDSGQSCCISLDLDSPFYDFPLQIPSTTSPFLFSIFYSLRKSGFRIERCSSHGHIHSAFSICTHTVCVPAVHIWANSELWSHRRPSLHLGIDSATSHSHRIYFSKPLPLT